MMSLDSCVTRRTAIVAGLGALACVGLAAGCALDKDFDPDMVTEGLPDYQVDLVLEACEQTKLGTTVLSIWAGNEGRRDYAILDVGVRYVDADGRKVGDSVTIELLGWLPAGGGCSYEYEVFFPKGAVAAQLEAVIGVQEAKLVEFGGPGISVAVLGSRCAEGAGADVGCFLDVVVINAKKSDDYGTNQPGFSSIVLALEALGADGAVVGEAAAEVISRSKNPLMPGSRMFASLPVPVEGAEDATVKGLDSFTLLDLRDRGLDYGFPTVELGTYPQGVDGEPAPIEWLVLDQKDSRKLLLSKRALDCRPYNYEDAETSWEGCTLRSWLNADFLSAAFTDDELARIVQADVDNPDNPDLGTRGGAQTADRAFLLSIEEVCTYFEVQTAEKTKEAFERLVTFPTDYAVWKGAYMDRETGGCNWWLRSPGRTARIVACVRPYGIIDSRGDEVYLRGVAVRPAMWVREA